MRYRKITIIVISFAVASIAVATTLTLRKPPQQSVLQNPSLATSTSASLSTTPASSTTETKTYRNEQFGFGFQYPSNLVVRENTFGNYYSKFNLQVEDWNKGGKYLSVFDVNIVLPEFADRTFLGVGVTTSSVIIDEMPGIKYKYEFEGLPEIAVVLPLGRYKAILGIGGTAKFYGHEDTFNQILASFKFLE